MDKKLLKKYADIKAQIASLEVEKKELEDLVVEEIESNADDHKTYRSSFGFFEVSGRKTWKYSPVVEHMKEDLKLAKKKEESSGVAELMRHSTFVVFTPNKDE